MARLQSAQQSQNASSGRTPVRASTLQRTCACGNHASGGTCAHCAEEQRKRRVSRFASRASVPPAVGDTGPERVPPIVHDVLRGSGRRLPHELRAFIEPRFGLDFSHVRVHTDGEAARSAGAVGARAYTVGSHIVFGQGEFRPDDAAGRRLIAHELTHVVQQRGASGAGEAPDTISDPADASEFEAEATAHRVLSSDAAPAPGAASQTQPLLAGLAAKPAAPAISRHPGPAVQRLPEELTGITTGFAAVGAFGAGILIGTLAGAFDRERFTTDQLIAYLNGLAVRRTPEGARISDNKARDVVRHWQDGDARVNVDRGHRAPNGALTSIALKRLLIREMLLGATAGGDESAIITILERSTPDDVLELLNPASGVSVQMLDNSIGGDNHDRLEAVLEAKFPPGSAARAQEASRSACTARQGVMVSHARQAAVRWVENAIMALNRLEDAGVRQALDCRFRGGTLAHRRQILERFERVRQELPKRRYFCAPETGPAVLEPVVLHSASGRRREAECVIEDADSWPRKDGQSTDPEVVLCRSFFKRDPDEQALTIVHESVHAAGLLGDPKYEPGCGLSLEVALQNPDSFAYLAADLMRLTGSSADPGPRSSLPTVFVGNFRNRGPVSDDNASEVGEQIPGLGPDGNTGLNLMELRGDVTGRTKGVQFEFRRTKEVAIWRKEAGAWTRVHHVPAGTDDNLLNRDESLSPRNQHIYAIDGPGLDNLGQPLGPAHTPGAEEAFYKASFVESVEARVPPAGWTRVSNEFAWHSITWLERSGEGAWTRKAAGNENRARRDHRGQRSARAGGPAAAAAARRRRQAVMRQTNASVARPAAKMSSATLARKCDCGNHSAGGACPACAEENKKRRVSRYAAGGARPDGAVPSIVDDAVRAPGQRLPADLRASMEPRFGADFSDVRVHTDDVSARAAHAVAASAYTLSSHVVFGAGQYAPGTDSGRRLLAHELTHVVQQRQAGADSVVNADRRISDPSDAAEREADATAERVTAAPAAGARAPAITHGGTGVQRLPEALTGISTGFGVVGAFGAGILIGSLAGAFDRDTYTSEELVAYLDGLARRRRHEGNRNSDNKARDVVRHWLAGDPKIAVSRGHMGAQGALTPVDLKRLLIAEMLDGATTGPDEEAILEILERSTAAEILEIIDPAKGVSVNRLQEDLDGDNNARLQVLLEERFPRGSAVRAQQDTSCRGARSVMTFVALGAATARVNHAINALVRPADPDVQAVLHCRFRGASAAQIADIRALLERVRDLLPSREFHCLHGFDTLTVGGEPIQCMGEHAATFVSRRGDIPTIGLCDQFFDAGPEAQAVTIIHETAHSAGLHRDIRPLPPCGWDLNLALQEPDSYALLASELFAARATAGAGGVPAPAPAPAPVPAPAGGGGTP